jgi:hypothetical protein
MCEDGSHFDFSIWCQVRENPDEPARSFTDYTVTVDDAKIPAGVSLLRKVN